MIISAVFVHPNLAGPNGRFSPRVLSCVPGAVQDHAPSDSTSTASGELYTAKRPWNKRSCINLTNVGIANFEALPLRPSDIGSKGD